MSLLINDNVRSLCLKDNEMCKEWKIGYTADNRGSNRAQWYIFVFPNKWQLVSTWSDFSIGGFLEPKRRKEARFNWNFLISCVSSWMLNYCNAEFCRTDCDKPTMINHNGCLLTFGQRDSKVSTLGPDTGAIWLYASRIYLATWVYLCSSLPRTTCTSSAESSGWGSGEHTLSLEYVREEFIDLMTEWTEFFSRMTRIHLDYATSPVYQEEKKEKCIFLFICWNLLLSSQRNSFTDTSHIFLFLCLSH